MSIVSKEKWKKEKEALAGVVQWIEHGPVNQRVAGFDSQSAHMAALQARSPLGGVGEASPLMFLFLSFSLPSSLSKNK